jgi:hypothetical protein
MSRTRPSSTPRYNVQRSPVCGFGPGRWYPPAQDRLAPASITLFTPARISRMAGSFRHSVCAFSSEDPAFPTTSC